MNRKDAHQFFDRLVAGKPVEEQLAMLKEVIVDYWLFAGIQESLANELGKIEQEVAVLMQNNQKIPAIKQVRAATGLGLKEAKDWVEGNFPEYSKAEAMAKELKFKSRSVDRPQEIVQQLAMEYNVPWEST